MISIVILFQIEYIRWNLHLKISIITKALKSIQIRPIKPEKIAPYYYLYLAHSLIVTMWCKVFFFRVFLSVLCGARFFFFGYFWVADKIIGNAWIFLLRISVNLCDYVVQGFFFGCFWVADKIIGNAWIFLLRISVNLCVSEVNKNVMGQAAIHNIFPQSCKWQYWWSSNLSNIHDMALCQTNKKP